MAGWAWAGLLAGLLAALLSWSGAAQAQAYPSRPINLIVPFGPGSGTDQMARGLSQYIGTEWPGTVVVVNNKPGANGLIAAQEAARAPADGYTLFVTTHSTQAANPYLYKLLPYDPVGDFTPVSGVSKGNSLLVVPTGSPINSIADLIALAKKKSLSYGSGNTASRVGAELFKQMAGIDLLYVPYKSNPAVVTALLGNEVDVMFGDAATALPLLKGGKLRAIGYSGLKRSPLLPNVPTIDESGVKGFELTYWVAVYAPRGTPAEIVNRLNQVIARSMQSDIMAQVFRQAVVDPFPTTPAGLAEFQRSELDRWGRAIHAARIDPE
jgi:tripartite-type tricarboxylate transporter receptor subunit TctC